jgi:hypothetical protein
VAISAYLGRNPEIKSSPYNNGLPSRLRTDDSSGAWTMVQQGLPATCQEAAQDNRFHEKHQEIRTHLV